MKYGLDREFTVIIHAKYMPVLEKLGRLPLINNVIVNDIGIDDAIKKKAYRDMKAFKFEGSIIEFFCWISVLYLIDEWKKRPELNWESLYEVMLLNKYEARNILRIIDLNVNIMFKCFYVLENKPDDFIKYFGKLKSFSLYLKYYEFEGGKYNDKTADKIPFGLTIEIEQNQ